MVTFSQHDNKLSDCPCGSVQMNLFVLPVTERVPIGTSDSGRTLFFPGRNGPARPAAAGRSRPPGHSRPWVLGRLMIVTTYARALSGTQTQLSTGCTRSCYISTGGHHSSAFLIAKTLGLCAVHLVTREESSCSREAFPQFDSNSNPFLSQQERR